MRFLADENFPKSMVQSLRSEGHDFLWARTHLSGARDIYLLDLAEAEERIVSTLDKDFWQIALQRKSPPKLSGVVLFRLHTATPQRLAILVRACVQSSVPWPGYISTIRAEEIQMVSARKT